MLLLVDNAFLKATEIGADEYIFLERGANIQIKEISDREKPRQKVKRLTSNIQYVADGYAYHTNGVHGNPPLR